MSEGFNAFDVLGTDFEPPPTFEEAARTAVERFQDAAARFQARCENLDPDAFTDEQWAVIEHTVAEMEAAIERCDEGYVAVQYDSAAWYRILESLDQVTLRLESTIGLIDTAMDT